ncbi:FtsK/SpoIIIE domain-containing protein [Shouchella sp. 1P09AA]
MIEAMRRRLWKYRGHRITPHMKHALWTAGLGIGIPVFLAVLFYSFKDSFPISQWNDWGQYKVYIAFDSWNWSFLLSRFSVALLIASAVVGIVYLVAFDKFKQLLHKQKIARMFFSNRFYEQENIQTESGWTNKTVTKRKITYFPRAYYQVKNGHIYVRVALDLSRFQARYLELGTDLENGLFCDLVDREVEEGFVVFKLLYDVSKNRIPIQEVQVKNGSMSLMKNVYWEFDKLPHMLIAGGTGGGKTYFILTIIQAVLKSNANIRILDPKNADLADLEAVLPKGVVYSKKNGIMMCLRKSVENMMKRSEEMKQMPNYKTGENYAYLGLPPMFIFFDEYVAFMDLLEPQERMEALGYMKQLVMLGRQMGYFLVLGAQRPDAKYLADGIRDQFNFRVTLGKMSESGYGMMFGDVDKTFVNKSVKGRGYADTGTSTISEFYSPLVTKDYDFMEEIKQAQVGVYGASATAVASGSVATETGTSGRSERSE